MKKVLGVGLLLLGAIVLGPRVYGEDVTDRYASRAQAERDDAFTHGWLPTDLPANATDIVSRHNLDTNANVVEFTLPAEECRAFDAGIGWAMSADGACTRVTLVDRRR